MCRLTAKNERILAKSGWGVVSSARRVASMAVTDIASRPYNHWLALDPICAALLEILISTTADCCNDPGILPGTAHDFLGHHRSRHFRLAEVSDEVRTARPARIRPHHIRLPED